MAGRFQQMVTGVQRYIANTFSDNDKNNCIKILINRHISQRPYGVQQVLNSLMDDPETRSKFEAWKSVKIAVLTWNLAGKAPPTGMDVSQVILPTSRSP
jgi:hypothetical protein